MSVADKANYQLPTTLSVPPFDGRNDLPQCTVHPHTRAGDVVLFGGMGTGHGVG
jgi:hypothetical protein